MVKYSDVKLVYSCPACPPEGVYMDRNYRLFKKDGKLYFTDGNAEFTADEWFIKMLFTPNCNWDEVDFSEDVVKIKK